MKLDNQKIKEFANTEMVSAIYKLLSIKSDFESDQLQLFKQGKWVDNNWVQIAIKQQAIIDKIRALESQMEIVRNDLNNYANFIGEFSADSLVDRPRVDKCTNEQ